MKKTLTLLLGLSCYGGFSQLISTYAGNGTAGYSGNGGFAQQAMIHGPQGLALDGSGNLYIADNSNQVIRKVTPQGIISTFAGGGATLGDGGPATSAKFLGIGGLDVDPTNAYLYVADATDQRIRRIDLSTLIINTVAGTGVSGYNGDGIAATSAKLNFPSDVVADGSGNFYISDEANQRIRKVSGGTISTIAGTGSQGYNITTVATSARLNTPGGIDLDASGANLYVADKGNHIVRVINSGVITTVAGTPTVSGFSGNGGSATAAKLDNPREVAVVGSSFYIADLNNNVVRVVNSSGVINAYAGTGTAGFNGDGLLATSAQLNINYGITASSTAVYISDYQSNRVRMVSTLCPANAGPNVIHQQSCCGWPGVQIGSPAVPNMVYSWSPSTNLSSTSIAQPVSSWMNTTTPIIYTVTVSSASCTTNTSSVQVTAKSYTLASCCRISHQQTSASSTQGSDRLQVFPNPSHGTFTIQSGDVMDRVTVMDIQGKQLLNLSNTGKTLVDIDLSAFGQGVYLLLTESGGHTHTQKLLIQ